MGLGARTRRQIAVLAAAVLALGLTTVGSWAVQPRFAGASADIATVSADLAAKRPPRIIRYSVRVKGKPPVNRAKFASLAQETYDDPRGWKRSNVRFVRVKSGGAFTLWISSARLVPRFSSGCSATWSCRVGRNVIINAQRWRHASPAWNRSGRSLRGYQHMVLNHETGHWLGLGHSSCPRRGARAPVMMQQSKGRNGCIFNSWPNGVEVRRAR